MASERDSSLLLDNIKLFLSSCARTVADFLWRPGAPIAQRVGQADKRGHHSVNLQRSKGQRSLWCRQSADDDDEDDIFHLREESHVLFL